MSGGGGSSAVLLTGCSLCLESPVPAHGGGPQRGPAPSSASVPLSELLGSSAAKPLC